MALARALLKQRARRISMRKLLFTALFASAACTTNGGSSQSDDPSTVQTDLVKANGGETTSDEAPEFGEAAEFDAAAIEPDAAYTDALASDPGIAAISSSATLDAHRVMIVWGKLPADPGTGDTRDWSGSIAVNEGGLLVGRTVNFEAATDHLLPRSNIQTVPFDSVTGPYIDGLVLRVLEPSTAMQSPVTLTYTAAASASANPITYSFDLGALEQGPVKIDAGNGYVMVAVELGEKACNQGFMRGRFHQLLPNIGEYRGIVTDETGMPVGHVRGIYGQLPSGDVIFGKFIDHEGHFVGLINGTYGSGDIAAKWIDKQGDRGAIVGKYFESTAVDGGGFFTRYVEDSCASSGGGGGGSGSAGPSTGN
ncbi:MAG TPA: hypothetical protein VH143_01015 [Kofleriaceae bacterium]|nr:hypothetical protein [Kofleriaceae bacterium]